jgi:hypothetical protein
MKKPVYHHLAHYVTAYSNCVLSGNIEWKEKHLDQIEYIVKNFLPSGSGIDNGVKLVLEDCNSKRLVFDLGYHHMDEFGSYGGWTYHKVTVRPDFLFMIDISISGPNKNDIKGYLGELLNSCLSEVVDA